MTAVLITSSASFGVAQVVISMVVLAGVVGVAVLPDRARVIALAAVAAVIWAGVSVAMAVPYHCDPVWKWLGICG